MPAEALHGESAGLGSCFHAEVVASLQTSLGEDSMVDSPRGPPHADAEAPRTLRKPLWTESSLSTRDPPKTSTALWVQQRGWRRGHALPPRASLNDNQLLPGGDQGVTPGTQVLGLLLATNRTVNVGPQPHPCPRTNNTLVWCWEEKGVTRESPGPSYRPASPSTEGGQSCKTLSVLGKPDLPRAPN
ncbi:hypothetical protein D623_10026127 [Myotis brandtii]|uniref:Uncharacterized protein n=1 Tax=Myotis brandtii TaxID=109478 RepID=S7MK59_MYOBR|nr:hypothetical protein D623_10026127 [Myotis brandtii]